MADVAILGSGTAGLSAAIFLAQAGVRALILARVGRPPKRIGESLLRRLIRKAFIYGYTALLTKEFGIAWMRSRKLGSGVVNESCASA